MKSEFQIKFDFIEILCQKKHERVAGGEGGEGGGHERHEGCQHWQLQHVEGGGGGGQLAVHPLFAGGVQKGADARKWQVWNQF